MKWLALSLSSCPGFKYQLKNQSYSLKCTFSFRSPRLPPPPTHSPQSLPSATFPSLPTHINILLGARCSSLHTVTIIWDEQPRDRSSIPHHISYSKRPDQLCTPSSIPFNGYRELFPYDQIGRSVTLSIHLNLQSRLLMIGATAPFPLVPSMCVFLCVCVQRELYLYLSSCHKNMSIYSVDKAFLINSTFSINP